MPSAPSPREQPCRLGGRCKEQPPNLARTPWSGVSIPLQARGHRRSMTPWAQCSSADPTEPGGWSARPLRSSPAARKHSSSTKKSKKARPPHLGVGHEKAKETLQDLGNSGRKSWEAGEEGETPRPLFIAVPSTKLQASRKAEACVARDDTTLHGQKTPSVTTPRRDRKK